MGSLFAGAGLQAGGSLIGGLMGAKASNKAADRAWMVQKHLNKKSQLLLKSNRKRINNSTAAQKSGNKATEKSNITDFKSNLDKNLTLYAKNRKGNITDINKTTQGGISDVNKAQQHSQWAYNTAKNKANTLFNPTIKSGTAAQGAFDYNLGIGAKPSDYTGLQESAATKFLKQQGLSNIQNSAAAKGGLYSGGTLAALNTYNNGLASQDEANQMNWLSGNIDRGNTAAGNLANSYQNWAGNTAANSQWGAGQRTGINQWGTGARVGENTGYTNAVTGANNAATNAITGARDTWNTNNLNIRGNDVSNWLTASGQRLQGLSAGAPAGVASAQYGQDAGALRGAGVVGAANAGTNYINNWLTQGASKTGVSSGMPIQDGPFTNANTGLRSNQQYAY